MSNSEVKSVRTPWSILAVFVVGALVSATSTAAINARLLKQLSPKPEHSKSTCVILKLIDQAHYRRKPLDNNLSSIVYSRFLKNLDPNRSVFLARDIKSFKKYQFSLDDSLRKSDLRPAFHIYNLYRKRLNERAKYALSAINSKFNFKLDERYQFDRSKSPWVSSKKALNRIWYKRVKYDYLNLKLAGKKHKAILVTLRKRYERLERRNKQSKAEDVYQQFMNAFTLSIEPHTSYLSARLFEDFNIHMSLSLEGIGAQLGIENEHTIIRKVIKGGPAALSGRLHKDDLIIGVAQGNGKMKDVVGERLDDVVRLIRGKKGTTVRLLVQPKGALGAKPKIVTIVRNKIKLEDQAAKKSIIVVGKGANKKRIGVITLPTFYRDFKAQGPNSQRRSTTVDVQALIVQLQQEKVDGIMIDLRGNGGGSLLEAIRLTGLFIRSGPVVQIRDTFGRVTINSDTNPKIAYSGPLAVLVDHGSASASEIFAGAIQDYKRGIILGEPTFGKGTVQQLFSIKDNLQPNPLFSRIVSQRSHEGRVCKNNIALPKSLGQLKLTVAQFFRINGESTQHRGVLPDIYMPSMFGFKDHGESSLKHAIPWASISATSFASDGLSLMAVDKSRVTHKQRVDSSVAFKYFRKLSQQYKEAKKQKYISLLEKKQTSLRKSREALRLKNINQMRIALGMKPKTKDSKREPDEKDPSQLIILNEAASILSDYITFSTGTPIVKK